MAKPPAAEARPRAHYTDATEKTFRRALETLKTSLPAHHAALAELVDTGRFDDIVAIAGVFKESGK